MLGYKKRSYVRQSTKKMVSQIRDSMEASLSKNDDERHLESIVTGETFTGLNCSVRKKKRNRLKN